VIHRQLRRECSLLFRSLNNALMLATTSAGRWRRLCHDCSWRIGARNRNSGKITVAGTCFKVIKPALELHLCHVYD
jgi:hypothetical protein